MTNQLNISPQNHYLNWAKLWLYSKIFLVCLFVSTLLSAVASTSPAVYLVNIAFLMLLLSGLFLLKLKKSQTPFIYVEDGQLHYFCRTKKENISIPVREIVKVTSQFCELQIHTGNHTYCLNLNNIRQEKQRWEIKEMIKKLAPAETNKVVNF